MYGLIKNAKSKNTGFKGRRNKNGRRKGIPKLGQKTDVTLSWMTEINPDLEQWRSLAEEWLKPIKRGKCSALNAVKKFLYDYIHEKNTSKIPAQFLRRDYIIESFYHTCLSQLKTSHDVKRILRYVNNFLNWVLDNYFSVENDDGIKVVPKYERGSKDFSIPTIGRLLAKVKGPSEQTIRNKEGADYRALMQCWASYVDGVTKKPKAKQESAISEEILEGITDPTIRALVGVVLAENRKLKGENSLLKRQTTITIDMRTHTRPILNSSANVEILPLMSNLLPSEITALQHAISDEFLKEQGWTTDGQGRIKYKEHSIYKAGYVTAIKKVLSTCLEDK